MLRRPWGIDRWCVGYVGETKGGYADRVVAFYEGRIIADGSPDAVLSNAEVQRYDCSLTRRVSICSKVTRSRQMLASN